MENGDFHQKLGKVANSYIEMETGTPKQKRKQTLTPKKKQRRCTVELSLWEKLKKLAEC